MIESSDGRCRACGVACDQPLCDSCLPAQPLLDPEPDRRLAALESMSVDQRRFVLLAALRGGHLWDGVRVGAVDLGTRLLDWLLRHGGTETYLRWIAEDVKYGSLAWETCVSYEFARTLLRAPMWLARDDAPVEALLRGFAADLTRYNALGFRLGSCQLGDGELARVIDAAPRRARSYLRKAFEAGRANPTMGTWYPTETQRRAARGWRRWPIERLEPDGLLACTICGESLPGSGACLWCGNDPDRGEPASLLPVGELLERRLLCSACGLDQTTACAPLQCPCCGQDLA
jgi:hypothetical protein